MLRLILSSLLLAGSCALAHADEDAIALKKAPGHDVVANNCAVCHSLDYIQMNSSFMDAKTWDGEVNKMIKTYGAPIADEDARTIKDYLIKNYGQAGS